MVGESFWGARGTSLNAFHMCMSTGITFLSGHMDFFRYFTVTLEASNSYELPAGTCALACPPGRGTSLLSVPLQPFEGSRAAMRPARGFAAGLPAPEPHGKPSGGKAPNRGREQSFCLPFSTAELMI